MVKADPKRNYYADLEVPPDADADEIRKQFRKLALKWHPDRNPGREAECVPRFQAIQAAHEILGDPAERTRYDLERRKRGGAGTYTPRQPAPRGNPYQARSDFPPPPRRTGPQRASQPPPPPRADYANPTGSTGANRYSSFPKPPPTARRDNATGDQKANVFTAWQSMKGKPGAHSGQADSSHQRAKSAWEFANEQQQKPGVNRSQSTRMPKRGGFDPTTPGADEPPAASTSSYFTTSNYGRPVPPPPPPPREAGAPNPNAARQHPVDPLRQFREQFQKDPYPEGMRTRTPYNSPGGERIFVDPVRRSASQRSSPHREHDGAHAGAYGAPGARHHSASPPRRKGNATRPFAMYSSSEEDEPPRQSQKAPQTNQQAGAGVNGNAAQNAPMNGSTADNVDGGMGQKSKSSMYGNFIPLQARNFNNPTSPNIKPTPKAWPYWAYPSSLPPRRTCAPSSTENDQHTVAENARKRSATNNVSPTSYRASQRYRNSTADDKTSFTFPVDTNTFAPTNGDQFKSKSKSTENINTKFSPGDWHGKFEGKPDYFTTGPMPPAGSRTRKSPSRPPSARKNSAQSFSNAGAPQMPQPSPQPSEQPAAPPQPAGTAPATTPGPVKFSPEEWVKTFKDATFVLPAEPPPKSTSPKKGPPPMRGRKQSKSRPTTANVKSKQPSVADADDESSTESVENTNDATATDGSAMDIDPTPPAPQTNGTQRPKIVPTPISQARAAQKEQAQAQGQFQAKAQDEGDGTLRFQEFTKVAPFTSTSQEGLRDLNDLTQNLPFESRPAASHPAKPAEPATLRLPEVPKAPELPQRLTMSAWGEYLPKMAAYVRAFQQFDSHMLQHFAARHQETEEMGTPANWLGAMGDTMSGGFNSYMRGIKEDERARAHWDIGWQKHKDAMELFEGCRARVLKGGLPA